MTVVIQPGSGKRMKVDVSQVPFWVERGYAVPAKKGPGVLAGSSAKSGKKTSKKLASK